MKELLKDNYRLDIRKLRDGKIGVSLTIPYKGIEIESYDSIEESLWERYCEEMTFYEAIAMLFGTIDRESIEDYYKLIRESE